MNNSSFPLEHMQSLSRNPVGADGKIATYILNNLHELNTLKLNSIADATDTSYATVCRFFRRMDLSGFKEFKFLINEEIKNSKNAPIETPDFNFSTDSSLTFTQINDKICAFYSNVIQKCGKMLRLSDIEKISKMFANASQIYFVGLGTSAVTAQYAYTKFFRLKLACSFDTDMIIAKMKAGLMTKKDILFAISSSGRTKSILEIARIARTTGTTIISLSDYTSSPLSNIANINLSTTVRESNKYIDEDFPLIQGQITIIDILYSCLYHHFASNATRTFQKTKEMVRGDKDHTT